jgi:hypothetical protein
VAGNVPSHTCQWYPLSWLEEEWAPAFKTKERGWGRTKPRGWPGPVAAGQPALWACAVERRCTKTLDAVDAFRLGTKMTVAPSLPSWYPGEDRAQFLRDTTPDGVLITDDLQCSACGKQWGDMDSAMRHARLKHG